MKLIMKDLEIQWEKKVCLTNLMTIAIESLETKTLFVFGAEEVKGLLFRQLLFAS